MKPEALDKPVVCAARARGLGVTDKPIKADALSDYLATRGKNLGYTQRINYLAIRRRTATHFAEKVGVERARKFMNHHPDSRALETHYLDFVSNTDFASISIDQGETIGPAPNHGQSADLLKGNSHLALGAMSHDIEVFKRVHGLALNIIAESSVKRAQMDGVQGSVKNLKKRARRAARKWLLGKESAKMIEDLSVQQWGERLDSLERCNFWDHVLQKAREDMQDPSSDDKDDSQDPTVDHKTGLFHAAPLTEDPEEPDLEDQGPSNKADGSYDCDIIQEGDEGFAPEDQLKDVPYDNAAKAFMDHLLENTFSQYRTFKYNPVHCPSCLEDPTAAHEYKVCRYNLPPARLLTVHPRKRSTMTRNIWRSICSECTTPEKHDGFAMPTSWLVRMVEY